MTDDAAFGTLSPAAASTASSTLGAVTPTGRLYLAKIEKLRTLQSTLRTRIVLNNIGIIVETAPQNHFNTPTQHNQR
jgi:hypothetical protein